MSHNITVLLHNIKPYTKNEIYNLCIDNECNIDAEFDIYMFADYIKIEFTRYVNSQDEALLSVLGDLEYMGLRHLLSSIELEVWS